jgi:hypothetical protein
VASKFKTKALWAAGLEVSALCLLACTATAAPPGRPSPRSLGQLQTPAPRLDLRAPSHAEETGNMAQKSPSAFPAMAHRQYSAQEQVELPLLGSDGMHARPNIQPSIQEFVQKVHREGLPVARLFETKSALLHLGLSPRGKPGLWLVQKTH